VTCTAARILVVDDDARFRALVRHLLARAGMEVLEAALGEDALEVATTSTPDGVILDVGPVDMDGFEVCRELRDHMASCCPSSSSPGGGWSLMTALPVS
jgi:DNA-binding response OmpR family regulator